MVAVLDRCGFNGCGRPVWLLVVVLLVVVLMVIVGSASFSGCLRSCFRDCSGAYFCGCWWLLVAVFVVVGGFWWLFLWLLVAFGGCFCGCWWLLVAFFCRVVNDVIAGTTEESHQTLFLHLMARYEGLTIQINVINKYKLN